ncbi:lasso peptide biosynthesis B2 protein [Azotosporobacter soli]|uniref:lasso peptide biosynthesis B2 protein n=1 Tax=Azotosporobacter soli TaxID=3055040 RepID=UPI0031FF2773
MFKRLRQFNGLAWCEQSLIIRIVILTAAARTAILLLPFCKLSLLLGKEKSESPAMATQQEYTAAWQVGSMIERVSRYTPWQSKCLVQALVGKLLLQRLGIDATLYMGVAKDADNKMIAHAWLRCGEMIVTGSAGREQFTVVGCFASRK